MSDLTFGEAKDVAQNPTDAIALGLVLLDRLRHWRNWWPTRRTDRYEWLTRDSRLRRGVGRGRE